MDLRPRPLHVASLLAIVGASAVIASLVIVGQGAEQQDPPKYTSSAASVGSVTRTVQLDGNVQLDRVWDVSSDGPTLRSDPTVATSGESGRRVTAVRARPGMRVTAGQVLVRVDDSVQELRLAAAQQELDAALEARDEITTTSGMISTTTSGGGGMSGASAGGGTGGGSGAGGGEGGGGVDAAAATPGAATPPNGNGNDDAGAPADDDEQPATELPDDENPNDTKPDASKPTSGRPSSQSPVGGRASRAQQTPQSSTTRESAAAVIANADSRVASARAGVQEAQEALDHSTVRAPVDGTVVAVAATKGALTGSDALVTINGAGVTLQLDVEEVDVPGLSEGDGATVNISAIDRTLDATVAAVGDASGGASSGAVVTFPVTLRLTGLATGVRDSMSASATIQVDSREQTLVVPASAIQRADDGATYVRVLEDERDESPKRTPVTIGLRGDSAVEVAGGIEAGALVVVTTSSASSSNAGSASTRQGGFPNGASR